MFSKLFQYFKNKSTNGRLAQLENVLLFERDTELLLQACVEYLELINFKEVLRHYRPVYGRRVSLNCGLTSVWELRKALQQLLDALTTKVKLDPSLVYSQPREITWEDYHSYDDQHIDLRIWREIEELARLYSSNLSDAMLCRPREVAYLLRLGSAMLSDLIATVLALKAIKDLEHESRSQKRNPGSSGQS